MNWHVAKNAFADPEQRKAIEGLVKYVEGITTPSTTIWLDKPELMLNISNSTYANVTQAEAWTTINLNDYLTEYAKRVYLEVWAGYMATIKAPGAAKQTVRSFEWRILFPIISNEVLSTSPSWAGSLAGHHVTCGFSNRTNAAGSDDADRMTVQYGRGQLWADVKPGTNILQYYLSRVMYKGTDGTETTDATNGNISNIYTKIYLLGYEKEA